VLNDFGDYNEFLDEADATVAALASRATASRELSSGLSIRRHHADDVTNCTNRSPYPTLHLLREASVTRAVETYPACTRSASATSRS